MTIPFFLAVVLGAIFFWRVTVWLGIEDFMYSWKGFAVILGLMFIGALVAAVL